MKTQLEVEQFLTPEFLRIHYGHELRQLLAAATVWHGFHDGKSPCACPHDGLSEDSVFLHARNLYDLSPECEQRRQHVGVAQPLTSLLYTPEFKAALHDKSLHVNLRRPYTTTGSQEDRLPHRVLEIADDVLVLWDTFTALPSVVDKVRSAMQEARDAAIKEAGDRASCLRIESRFS